MITSKTKSLNIDFTPLKPSSSMEVVGSVAGRQSYNGYTKEFTPDFTIVPLTLFPQCSAVDSDKYISSGLVNSKLTDMRWYDRTGGKKVLIEDGPDFGITADGARKGQLVVRKNSSVVTPLSLEFEASYPDPRTTQVIKFHETFTVIVSDETGAQSVVSIDSPTSLIWNPIREKTEQTITAKAIFGTKDLTDSAGTNFRWYRKLDNGSMQPIIDGNGDDDWEVVSVNKNVLKIDRDFIGDHQTYVCRMHHETSGSVVEPNDNDPFAMTTIVRRIPHVEADYKGVTYGVPGGNRQIRPVAYIRDNIGLIPNPEEWFKFEWYTKNPSASSFSKSAEGIEAVIPMVDGMMLDLRVEDKGPQAIIVDDNDPNIVITDGGQPLYQRIKE